MKKIRDATSEEMIHSWLKSESFRLKDQGINFNQKIIDTPDFSSDTENQERRQLMSHRNPILDEIPHDTIWKIVEVNKKDTNNIFIIPAFDWFLDTGKNFKLQSAFKNISPDRGYRDSEQNNHEIDHYNEVNRKLQFWKSHSDAERDEKIIMIGITKDDSLTIIDGTHRAIAFNRNNSYPWQAFIGFSKSMINCKWHIESPEARKYLIQCHQDCSVGVFW